jgi:uncharacterized membrane protein
MTELTDWAPNAHALVVHLPIGLLVTAAAADAAALLRRRPGPVATVSTALYLAGSLALAAAYLTGRGAAPEVYTPGLAVPVVARHWAWALWCLVYFGGLTAARVWRLGIGSATLHPAGTGNATARENAAPRRAARLAFAAAGLAGLVVLAVTAELGGRLVYEFGVGVAAPLGE